ncbi:MAG TPA: hypothetical protein VFE05_23765 [Longimicrobiaceae bacterium]|jgi:hypothetical protein|nr:hypothetical protein [Longimicrobiaceae bacterium]
MAYREFRDETGRAWMVWDTFPRTGILRSVRENYQAGWLTFDSQSEKRRLSPVPQDWAEAPEGSLLALLADATPVPAVHTPRLTGARSAG